MGNRFDGYVTILAPGVQQASGAASAGAAIPNMLSGEKPRFIRVAATVPASIRLGVGGVVATAADTQIQPGDAIIMHVPSGITNFAVIQVTAAGLVQISAMENM